MRLSMQKRLAAGIWGCSEKRVWIDPDRLEEAKEAITKADIRRLMLDHAILKMPKRGISRGRTRKRIVQRRKGRRQNAGSREGKKTARLGRKRAWINRIRALRELLHSLRERNRISKDAYRELYSKAKGGFFRNRRHIKIYLEEHRLITNEK